MSFKNWFIDGLIILERPFNDLEESDLKPQSYKVKSNSVWKVQDRDPNRDTLIEQSP